MARIRRLLSVLACAGAIASAAQAQTFSVLHSFQYFPHGASPYAPLYRDSSGNLYGTTTGGGPQNAGVIFKLDTSGNETVLHTFTGGTDGGNPTAGLVADSAGNLYGTAYRGGITGTGANILGSGVVYKIDTSGRFEVLYCFKGAADGSGPFAGVIVDAQGNLYGTTYSGGAQPNPFGVVYKLSPSGQETVLYTFQGDNGFGGADGANPYAGVTADRAGNLYGTTMAGGGHGAGVVYKLGSSGQETLLYSFGSSGPGGAPSAGVILDGAGNLYGVAGPIVYKLSPTGNYTALADFYADAPELTGLARDALGNLYITAGAWPQESNRPYGGVFKRDTAGKVSLLYKFGGAVVSSGISMPLAYGLAPNARVTLDTAGNLYGTSPFAGTAGIVYEIEPSGTVTWLHNFVPAHGGIWPWSGVTLDSSGNLYGTTAWGGGADDDGVVFKLGGAGEETVLHTFKGGVTDGARPMSGVVLDQAGNLYGSTALGGANNLGVIYKLTPSGQETILTTDAVGPTVTAIDARGNLYGPAGGGSSGQVFRLDTTGKYTVLYSFTGGADGGLPKGVVLDSAGNLYGTTYYGGIGYPGAGVVFKIDTTGTFSVLHAFLASTDGGFPEAGVTLDAAGNIYGTCSGYGPQGGGTVYKINTAGSYSVVYAFGQGLGGYGNPAAGVAVDPAGNLYGTLPAGAVGPGGPPGSYGQVYEIDTSGNATVLYSFTGGADGADPISAVTLDGAGHLYGTTKGGFFTPIGGGTAFKITLP